ncbi:MAG: hypothetical protein WHT46_09310 [Candidatus Geothermincolales bacterium]
MTARTMRTATLTVALLVALSLLAVAGAPALAGSSAGVTVKVTVRPCVRVLSDGTVLSNVPVARTVGQGNLTVIPL